MPLTSRTLSLSRHFTTSPSKFKFPSDGTLALLQSCRSIDQLKQIQAHSICSGIFSNTYFATKLLESCAVSALNIDYALRIFHAIAQPNTYSWTTLVRGFVASKMPAKAIDYYDRMRFLGVKPNKFTFLFVLKAYSMVLACKEGRILHATLVKCPLLSDEFLCNALIHLYAKCGEIEAAFQLFGEDPTNNLVTLNTLVAGCFACGRIEDARSLFDEMPERNVSSWNTAISGYCKWGHVDLARTLFDKMPERDLVTWSAVISGYSQSKRAMEAMMLFEEMLLSGIRPDSVVLVSVLTACSQVGALGMGKWIHAYVDRNKLRRDVVLGTSLVDMYAKCGCIDIALQVFHEMPVKNVFTWNAMICGLSKHGRGDAALTLFAQMELEHIRPNDITFVGVLCACGHMGLVDEGRRQFNRMSKEYNITCKIEHYGCMVDLLGRAGLTNEAKELVMSIPFESNIVVLGAFLSACLFHCDFSAVESVLKHLLKLGPGDGGCYALFSNIYARGNQWGNVIKIRKLMRAIGADKVPGCSSIEVNGVVHEFLVGDQSHTNSKEIFEVLGRIITHLDEEGYI